MMPSTHKVEVIRILSIHAHPNADRLGVVTVHDGYTVCIDKTKWKAGDLAAYVPPDSVVDTSRPEFRFLGEHKRIRAKKLRGIISVGLLVPAPVGAAEGEDVAEALGVTHYEPGLRLSSVGEDKSAPLGYFPKYDVESLQRYGHVLIPDEKLQISEKIHGSSLRICWQNGELHFGSRTRWKRLDQNNIWNMAINTYPEIVEWCKANEDCCLYGELYGQVQDLKYGLKGVAIAIFDVLKGSTWLGSKEARVHGNSLPWVPILFDEYVFKGLEELLKLADGQSIVPGANHLREGVVVRPLIERTHPEIGRVVLKAVSLEYLAK